MLSALITHLRVSGIFFDRIIDVECGGRCAEVSAFADAFAVFGVKRQSINASSAAFSLKFRVSHRLGLLAEASRDVLKGRIAYYPHRRDRSAAECHRAPLASAQENAGLGGVKFKVKPTVKGLAYPIKCAHASS